MVTVAVRALLVGFAAAV
jgi:hypothetical protein